MNTRASIYKGRLSIESDVTAFSIQMEVPAIQPYKYRLIDSESKKVKEVRIDTALRLTLKNLPVLRNGVKRLNRPTHL